MSELKNGLHKFFIRYNSNRRHSSLNNLTPDKFYTSKAREIAEGRYEFVSQFVDRFIKEF